MLCPFLLHLCNFKEIEYYASLAAYQSEERYFLGSPKAPFWSLFLTFPHYFVYLFIKISQIQKSSHYLSVLGITMYNQLASITVGEHLGLHL
jgi:hypothetical protein